MLVLAVSAFFLQLFKHAMIAVLPCWFTHSEISLLNFKSDVHSQITRGHAVFLSLYFPLNQPYFLMLDHCNTRYSCPGCISIFSWLVQVCNYRCLTTLICTLWKQFSSLHFKSFEQHKLQGERFCIIPPSLLIPACWSRKFEFDHTYSSH